MKVRIKTTPLERELDGVRLDLFAKGDVREVSASIGSWLIAQGYAEPEMRHTPRDPDEIADISDRPLTKDRRHRRSTDR